MAQIIIQTDFETARQALRSVGIILTKHRHKRGGYVGYANKALRQKLLSSHETNHPRPL